MWLAGTSQILLLCSTQVASIHIMQTHILQLRGGGDSVVIEVNDAEENDLSTATVKKSAMNEPRIGMETSTNEIVATAVREARSESVIKLNYIVEDQVPKLE